MKKPPINTTTPSDVHLKGISFSAARDLSNRYRKECQPLLSHAIPGKQTIRDARSVVFSIDMMKQLITAMENCAQKIGATNPLGIRFYYGKYPDIGAIKKNPKHPLFADFADLPENYAHLHTLFMVATYIDEQGIDRDFNPWQENELGGFVPISNDNTYSDTELTAQMNHGNLCPPPFSAADPDNKLQGLSF